MTLVELCEPLLQYMCRLNRSARKGGSHELARVKGEIKAILADMRVKAGSEPRLIDQYEKIELVLLFFVDFMIKESELHFAREWTELAYERNELAGDEKFFDLLDETLADSSEAASERLAVYYACMGLGFTGIYTGQPEQLRKKMLTCSARIRGLIEAGEGSRICPEAYEHVDTSDLVQPPGKKLLGIAIALVGLVIVVFVANVFLFRANSSELKQALRDIGGKAQSNAALDAAPLPAPPPPAVSPAVPAPPPLAPAPAPVPPAGTLPAASAASSPPA